jgi:hypothetical protein
VSIYPCDWHHRRIDGPLNAAYVSLLRGSERYSRRLRLCGLDLDYILGEVLVAASLVETDDLDDNEGLRATCGHPEVGASSTDALFASVYRKGSERADYYGRCCAACGDELVSNLRLDKAAERPI